MSLLLWPEKKDSDVALRSDKLKERSLNSKQDLLVIIAITKRQTNNKKC